MAAITDHTTVIADHLTKQLVVARHRLAHRASSSCHNRVEPSISVKRKVTVPDGPAIGHSVPPPTLHCLAL
jgi:hypothetical protein